jgi:biotin transport system permease protein/energy-coupling factor transport system permease protein
MALRQQSMFKYKTVKGPLHRVPALFKLALILPLSIFFMRFSPIFLASGIVAACIISFFCRLSFREQIIDLKAAAFYALLMYGLSLFSIVIESEIWRSFSNISLLSLLTPNQDFLRITLRLVLIIQLSSLLFRTTSSGEIRDALFTIEFAIRRFFSFIFFRKKHVPIKNSFSEYIALFLCFIPEIFENWDLLNVAWKARGGKPGFAKIKSLVFMLISLSMEKASLKAKALEARK